LLTSASAFLLVLRVNSAASTCKLTKVGEPISCSHWVSYLLS